MSHALGHDLCVIYMPTINFNDKEILHYECIQEQIHLLFKWDDNLVYEMCFQCEKKKIWMTDEVLIWNEGVFYGKFTRYVWFACKFYEYFLKIAHDVLIKNGFFLQVKTCGKFLKV